MTLAQLIAGIYARQSRNRTKSIAEQITAGVDAAADNGWPVAGTYQDGRSASRYATKARDDWERLLADVAGGLFNVLILWECSRGDRTLTSWSAMLDLCRDKHVAIYVVSDERLYDPRKARDWKTLANAGVDSAAESDVISMRVLRGQSGSAAAGRPSHGRTPYGYRRTYDSTNGSLIGQEIEPVTAEIVREAFRRVAKGEAFSAVVADFNRRKVPTGGSAAVWHRARLRDMLRNRVYIGERVLNGGVTEGTWPAIVNAEQFWAVQRVLTDPARRTTRPGRAIHLVSFLATTPCGGVVAAAGGRYRCESDSCVTIDQGETDDIVTRMVLARLGQPSAYGSLQQDGEDADKAVVTARADMAALHVRLGEWRRSAAKGETSPATMAAIEADLTEQIRGLQRRIDQAATPPALRSLLAPGEDIGARWEQASVAARRRIIGYVAEISVARAKLPGSRIFDPGRLGGSRYRGDSRTWGEHWAAAGLLPG